ncbi:MAG: hypothetical protein ACFFAH_17295 [Promethearchaeota archaeon]
MSLDKWIKDKKKKEEIKKKTKPKGLPEKNKFPTPPEKTPLKFSKTLLICPKAKCNYQKTIKKKNLTERDKICPRCKSTMKIKKS